MRYRQSNDLRPLTVKYPGTCAETGKPIGKGEEALWDAQAKCLYCESSKAANEYRDRRFAASWGMADANW